jgi:hypothetical protein
MDEEEIERLADAYEPALSPEIAREYAAALAERAIDGFRNTEHSGILVSVRGDEPLNRAREYQERLWDLHSDHPEDEEIVRVLAETQKEAVIAYCEMPDGGNKEIRDNLKLLARLNRGQSHNAVEEALLDAIDIVVETYTDVEPPAYEDDTLLSSTLLESIIERFEAIERQAGLDLASEISTLADHRDAVEAIENQSRLPFLTQDTRAYNIVMALSVLGGIVLFFLPPMVMYYYVIWARTGHGPVTAISNRIFLDNVSSAYRIADFASILIMVLEVVIFYIAITTVREYRKLTD